jgi:hypothetical protein
LCLELLESRRVPAGSVVITSIAAPGMSIVPVASEGALASPSLNATFTDSNAPAPANLTVTVDYGDGTPFSSNQSGLHFDPNLLVTQVGGAGGTTYTVTDNHTFPEESGSVVPPFEFTITLHVTENANAANADTATGQAQVLDAPLRQGNPVSAGTPQRIAGVGTPAVGTAIAAFEAAIGGTNNGANPPPTPLTSGFRDINWDGVKLDGTDFGGGPNTTVITPGKTVGIPLNRFQERGVFLGAVYAVSTDQPNGSFADVNPGVAHLFPSFSPHNTFAMFNDNGIDFKFVQPSAHGTALVSAASRAFGAVFINVEIPNSSFIEYFHNGTMLKQEFLPVGGKGVPVFVGDIFSSAIVTNVFLSLGTDVIFKFDGATVTSGGVVDNGVTHNLVVTDDFVYAEPQATTNGFPIVDGSQGVSAAATIARASASVPFNGVVAQFSDEDPNAHASDYTATINWGDGHLTNGIVTADGQGGFNVSGTNTYQRGGLFPIDVDVMDFGGGPGAGGSTPSLAVNNTILVVPRIVAVGADAGAVPEVRVFDADTGALTMDFNAYDPHFQGGVRVATANVDGDGVPDIITSPGPGGGPDIRVFDGQTGALIEEFLAYDPHFIGGVFVSAADLEGNGQAEIITSPGFGGGPDVRVFNDGNSTGVPNQEFMAYDPRFLGGVHTAVGRINGHPDIITAPGSHGGPDIRVFDPAVAGIPLIAEFLAYSPNFTGGVFVAAADLNGDAKDDIITGPAAGGGPEVKAFSGASLPSPTPTVLDDFFAYNPAFLGGARVAVVNINGQEDIVTGAGPGGSPHVRIFSGTTGLQLNLNAVDSFLPFEASFAGGVFVGGV